MKQRDRGSPVVVGKARNWKIKVKRPEKAEMRKAKRWKGEKLFGTRSVVSSIDTQRETIVAGQTKLTLRGYRNISSILLPFPRFFHYISHFLFPFPFLFRRIPIISPVYNRRIHGVEFIERLISRMYTFLQKLGVFVNVRCNILNDETEVTSPFRSIITSLLGKRSRCSAKWNPIRLNPNNLAKLSNSSVDMYRSVIYLVSKWIPKFKQLDYHIEYSL